MTTMERIREVLLGIGKTCNQDGFDGFYTLDDDEDIDTALAQIKTILAELDLTEGEIEEVMIDTLGGVETLKGVFRPLGLAKAIIAARDRKRGGE